MNGFSIFNTIKNPQENSLENERSNLPKGAQKI